MTQPWPLADLEIIGYADHLDESMRPAIVPPVFRSISNPDVVLVPPFSVESDVVSGATQLPFAEAISLGERQEITLFPGSPLLAKSDHELWLRRNGEAVYQPAVEASHELDQLCKAATERAVQALAIGDLDGAEAASSEAILSNDRSVTAFAIKAAIRRIRNNPAGESLMAELARPAGERPEVRRKRFIKISALRVDSLDDPTRPVDKRELEDLIRKWGKMFPEDIAKCGSVTEVRFTAEETRKIQHQEKREGGAE